MRQHILFLILACAQILGCAAQDTARLMQATSPPANSSAPQTAPSQGSPGGTPASGLDVRLPLESKSIRFAVIGDTGTGEREHRVHYPPCITWHVNFPSALGGALRLVVNDGCHHDSRTLNRSLSYCPSRVQH